MSPLELAGAYSAFANDGVYIKPYTITKIENMNGVVLYEHKQEMHVAMKESTAYMVNSSLVSVCGESGGKIPFGKGFADCRTVVFDVFENALAVLRKQHYTDEKHH